MSKKKTAAEIMQQGMDEEAADAKALIEEIRLGTEKPDSETEPASAEATAEETVDATDGGQKPAAQDGTSETDGTDGTTEETPAKRDWVKEAYECFVKDAKDIDPTDPVKAIEVYFEKNATDELKARCKAEGKDAEGCWKFIEAVARKALHGSSGHIDPAVVYAIAMHWFEDVPKDWDAASAKAPARQAKPAKAAKPTKTAKPKKPAETPSEIKKEKAKAKRAQRPATPKRKAKTQQGFFFEMLETPVEGGTEK